MEAEILMRWVNVNIVDLFSNREISIAIWTVIFIMLIFIMAIKNSKLRDAIYQLIKTAVNKYILIFTFVTFGYVALCIILLSNLSIWDWLYLKEVILWFLFIGVPICFNAIAERNKHFFSDLVKNNFKVAIFIEFIVGAFTYNIFTELFLVPTITLLFLFYAFSKTDESYRPAEKFFSFLLSTLGLIILFYAGKSAIQSYSELNILELFIVFSLPITMTFIFLPLSYCFALYSEYELLFIRLKFRLPDKNIRKRMKWDIIKTCKFSLAKVDFFSGNHLKELYSTMKTEDTAEVIDHFIFQYNKKMKSIKSGGEILNLDDNKSLNGYSLILAFLFIGLFSIFYEPFNSAGTLNISFIAGYAIVFIAIIALAVEINNILTVVEDNKSLRLSDLSVAIFLVGVIYFSWKLLNYLDWINNYTITLLMFIALLATYGLFRSIILIFKYIFLNSEGKNRIFELLLRVMPIIISIIALFLK